MVIHDRGYQRWDGDRELKVPGARTIFSQGVGVAAAALFKRRVLAILLIFAAYGPFLFGFVGLSFLYYVKSNFDVFPDADEILNDEGFAGAVTPTAFTAWFYLFNLQGMMVMLLSLMVGMGLIAEDRRSNALELYLSRPLRVWQYVLGKFGVLLFFFLAVTMVPALVLILLQLAFEEYSAEAVSTLVPLGLDVATASLVTTGFVALMALTVSALASRTRNAAVLWVALWVVSMILEPMVGEIAPGSSHLVSLAFHLGHVSAAILGTTYEYAGGVIMGSEPLGPTVAVLGGLAVLGSLIILRRVRPVEVVA